MSESLKKSTSRGRLELNLGPSASFCH